MPNPWFRFKQFTVWHNKCAMKVGTDGVLLGAWANPKNASYILDVGTGSGLIALMMAQKSQANIVAIDIDEQAVEQAKENFQQSAWQNRLEIIHTDFSDYYKTTSILFDYIVCNPPFFHRSLHAPDISRATARHSHYLSRHELLKGVSSILSSTGTFGIVIPSEDKEELLQLARDNDLYLIRILNVKPTPNHPPKRILAELSKTPDKPSIDTLVIEEEGRHQFSEKYKAITKDYYLKF